MILNQPQSLHAGMAVLADDDVIMHGDAERRGDTCLWVIVGGYAPTIQS